MLWWEKRNQREQIMIIIFIVVILPVAFYFYIYQPLQQDIKNKQQRLTKLQNDLKAEENLASDNSVLRKEYKKIKREVTSNKQVVTREGVADLIITINQLAEKNNLNLVALQPQAEQADKSYLKHPISLQLGGSYQNMLGYLEDLYHLNYLLRIERIGFSSEVESEVSSADLTMGIKVTGYNITDRSKGD